MGKNYRKRKTRKASTITGLSKLGSLPIIQKLILITSVVLALSLVVFQVAMVNEEYKGLDREDKGNQTLSPYHDSKFYYKKGIRYYEDMNYKSIPGIDVSAYQLSIDWNKVKNSGVKFAIIRVGYRGYSKGEIKQDKRFEENIQGALAAGLKVGVYFYSQAINIEEAIEEARYVLRNIKGYKVTMPVAYDMEDVRIPRLKDEQLTVEERTEIADAFCYTIRQKGYQPMIYGNPTWLTSHIDMDYLSKYKLWLAHYAKTTEYPYKYDLWQYSHSGRISGIPNRVDMNLYMKKR